jgi:hypothetical protein
MKKTNYKLHEGIFSRNKEPEDLIKTFFQDLQHRYSGNPAKMLECINYLIFNKYTYELCAIYIKSFQEKFDDKEYYAGVLEDYFKSRGRTDKEILDFYVGQMHADGELGQEIAADMLEHLNEFGWPSYVDKIK